MRSKLHRTAGLALVALALIWIAKNMLLPVGGTGTTFVRIPQGSSARQIAAILAENKVIPSRLGFMLLVRVTGKSANLKTGAYRFSPKMSPSTILSMIARGDVCARWITFPEGYTISQMGERLEAQGICSADKFIALATTGGKNFPAKFPHPDNLEGYLFPDTYLIPTGVSEATIISQMLDCFDQKVYNKFAGDAASSGMSLGQVITLASLIEREARVEKDRPLVSSVLRNRLGKNMRLECDATVLYALGRHKNRVLYRDLEINSPYNTYRNAGLPPGPIANPGIASVEAALHPVKADYLYYVARKDGTHIFSRTFDEHERARKTVR